MTLLHPDSLEELRCEVRVTGRGLLLRPLPARPTRRLRTPVTRVPWWSVQGFSADETDTAFDGVTRQVLEVVTDAGSLYLVAPAYEVSRILAEVGRYSARWSRSRFPLVAAGARAWALLAAALIALRRATAPVLAALWAAVLRAGAAAGRDIWAVTHLAGRGLGTAGAPVRHHGRRARTRATGVLVAPFLPLASLAAACGRQLATTPAGRVTGRTGRRLGRRVAAAGAWAGAWIGAGIRVVLLSARAVLRPVGHGLDALTRPVRARLARSLVGVAVIDGARGVRAGLAVAGTGVRSGARGLRRPVPLAVLGTAAVAALVVVAAVVPGPAPLRASAHVGHDEAVGPHGLTLSESVGGGQLNTSSMAHLVGVFGAAPIHLTPASGAPLGAPPSLAGAPPLRPHEVFGFAPYWTLNQAAGYDVTRMTTLAYFSIDVNSDGSLDESGSGWDGYQSQDLADLITRAHQANTRVVLTATCFDQGTLDAVTSDPSAPARLGNQLLAAVEAKNMDGVNLDFEGEGSGDQVGLTNLVAKVSAIIHAANPHYQVTMDTYASSAADPGGFYNIPALVPSVDGMFIMSYQLNLQGAPGPVSPLTNTMYTDLETVQQYTAVAPVSKLILGAPYYGYDWPTNNGTLTAGAEGQAVPVTYAQIQSWNVPTYWDPVTDTAWTSYQVGNQWHETFFEDPTSLYMLAELAQTYDFAGVGIWALGMDNNDPAMLAALSGFAPAVKDTNPGPNSTSPSSTSPPPSSTTTTAPTTTTTTAPPITTSTVPPTSTTTTTRPTGTTTTTGPPPTTTTTGPPVHHYAGGP